LSDSSDNGLVGHRRQQIDSIAAELVGALAAVGDDTGVELGQFVAQGRDEAVSFVVHGRHEGAVAEEEEVAADEESFIEPGRRLDGGIERER
jgi:hypothetical protein